MKIMKKNNFTKNHKRGWIVLMLLFCGLFANIAVGQVTAVANNDTFIWTGTNSSSWNDAGNWSVLRGTTTAGTNNYPGEVGSIDIVYVNKSDAPNPLILSAQTRNIVRLFVNNNFGDVTGLTGATLTINSDGVLNVGTGTASNFVVLNGGNIINNGALNINASGVGSSGFPTYGINCGNPSVLPTSPAEYSYSGSGTLSISMPNANLANAGAVAISGQSADAKTGNATYKLVLNNPTITLNQATTLAIGAIRAAGITAALPYCPKLLISGTGLTLGSIGTPSIGSLINVGSVGNVTIDTGTTLTLNSASGNLNNGLQCANSANNIPTVFNNKGTINILGFSSRSGLSFSTFGGSAATTIPVAPMVPSPNASIINFTNEGVINVTLNVNVAGQAAYAVFNGGGGTANAGSVINLTNTATGILTLKNTSTALGTGNAIYCISAGEAARSAFVNNGTLNLEGTVYHFGTKTTVTNSGIINSNSEFKNFTSITNDAGGSINFLKTAATATTRQVTFNGLASANASGVLGSIYRDQVTIPNIDYAVVVQKFANFGTSLIANVASGIIIPTSGTLARQTGGGTASIAYTSVTIPPINNALPVTTTNSGTINTGTGTDLNIISGVTTTGTIAPGGSSGKGIADFAKAAASLGGKTILQISGSATAGIDYDQITNSTVAGSLAVAGQLDVTGIYTPAGAVTIDIVTTEATGSLSGAFGTVLGISTGWTVVTTTGTGGKIQLVYDPATPATSTTWTGGGGTTGWNLATNWSNGVPDQNSDVTIGTGAFQPSPFVHVNIKSLTIDSGASLILNPTFNFTVKEAITNNGSLTVSNNANLIQVNNVANTGSGITTVNRNSNALSRLDYTLWSSPVTNASQFLTTFSPATDLNRFYNYDEVTNYYSEIGSPAATSFAAATGYLIRMPNDAVTAPTTQTFVGVFTGLPNNGNISKSITYNGSAPYGYNAIGNPYPSTIDAQAFIAANTANIESSLYFWRKINAAAGSAYAVYNPLGSTTATPSSPLPNGTIQVGQGFFVKAKSASSVNFTNAMRVANNQNQIFKTKQAAQKDRLWLNLSRPASKIGTINIKEVFSQALIGYTADATSGVDMYDAKYINDSNTALTSSINDEGYTIQGRPAFDATDVVALNFINDADVDYTIALDHFDGVFAAGQDVYLVDSKTGAETDLKTGSYTFAATAGVDNTRFSLKYQKTLKVDAPALNENSVSVYTKSGTLYVNSVAVAINTISVYDVEGRLIADQKNVKSTTAILPNLKARNQVLIVKIVGEDNKQVTKKVLN
jgi:trimeric autotransporter adhesin